MEHKGVLCLVFIIIISHYAYANVLISEIHLKSETFWGLSKWDNGYTTWVGLLSFNWHEDWERTYSRIIFPTSMGFVGMASPQWVTKVDILHCNCHSVLTSSSMFHRLQFRIPFVLIQSWTNNVIYWSLLHQFGLFMANGRKAYHC